MKRRDFLLFPSVTSIAAQSGALSVPPDSVTNPPGLEYFLLGNGSLFLGVQWTQSPEAGAQAGLVLMAAEHLNRKTGSLLWHPRSGLLSTRCLVVVNGKPFSPEPGRAAIQWRYPDGIPTVRIDWDAGPCHVTEDIFCPEGDSAVIRTVALENRAPGEIQTRALVSLRANSLLFDEYEVDRPRARLTASGYHHLELSAVGVARAIDREVEVDFGAMQPGSRSGTRFILSLDRPGLNWDTAAVDRGRSASAKFWRGRASIETGHAALDQMFRASVHGLRAVVADSGKMDGGPWGYNLEWVRDSSMAAAGAILAGLPEVGEAVLSRILTRMISDNGAALDSSFHRPPETIELDQNGQVLHSLWTHWAWTGSDSLIRQHWPRIRATADFALSDAFRDPRTGLVRNSREFWERSTPHGVRDGYELAYQAWNIAGWQRAVEMARLIGDEASAPAGSTPPRS